MASPLRVLLVEDDVQQRKLLAWVLRSEGCSVVEAASGVELLEWMGIATSSPQRIFDVVVSDIMMPDLTTIEVLSGWRYGRWFVPLVVVTAHDDPALHADAQALGAVAVLRKPVQPVALREAVDRATVHRQGAGWCEAIKR
jgi:two-component system response regulator CpxR